MEPFPEAASPSSLPAFQQRSLSLPLWLGVSLSSHSFGRAVSSSASGHAAVWTHSCSLPKHGERALKGKFRRAQLSLSRRQTSKGERLQFGVSLRMNLGPCHTSVWRVKWEIKVPGSELGHMRRRRGQEIPLKQNKSAKSVEKLDFSLNWPFKLN